ncbi:THUMP domain-containing protein [Candidatus Kapabacteria bacterium]|nr:THUMP domain-containing protein [Candidatus Kapabacteria bacterium]
MKILAKTFFALEDTLSDEILEIGGKNINPTKRGVWFEGNTKMLYKSNIMLRSALRILVPILEFTAYDERRLYKHIHEFDWSKYLGLDRTFAIDSVTRSNRFKHSQYVALKVKDAIVDQFRNNTGQRPSIDTKNPDILINVHLNDAKFTVSLDSSGDTLNKRGYREQGHPASLNEALAAGLILKSGWKGENDLLDPFCGSGTIPIEAALIATNTPPGLNRDFSFMNWDDFDQELWQEALVESKSKIKKLNVNIYGSDISERSVNVARECISNIGLNKIQIRRESFDLTNRPAETGTIITNPPYGERLKEDDLIDFYQKIGDTLKQSYNGWDAWILSGNLQALKLIGLKTSKKINCMNGDIECKFNKYELYRGTKRVFKEKSESE